MADFKTLNGFNVKDAEARTNIASLQTTVAGHTTDISNINGDISDIQGDITDLDNDKAKKLDSIVLFGDSWTDPTSLDAIWGTLIGGQLNLTTHNYALSGSYFSKEDATSLKAQIDTFESDTNVDKTKVKYIVALGGVNDFRNGVTYNTLTAKIEEQIPRLKAMCPQAKIVFVSNCRWYYDKDQGDYWCGVHEELRYGLMIPTLNLFGTMGKEMYNTNNYFHLTQVGQRIMLSNIVALLTGGEIQYWEDEITLSNSDGDLKISSQRVHNMVFINFDLTAKTSFASTTFNKPTGYYLPYYPLIGGWSDSNYKQFAFDLDYDKIIFAVNGNAIVGKTYHHLLCIPLNHK